MARSSSCRFRCGSNTSRVEDRPVDRQVRPGQSSGGSALPWKCSQHFTGSVPPRSGNPKSSRAARFAWTMLNSMSCTVTASPMLSNVSSQSFLAWRIASSARLLSVTSRKLQTLPMTPSGDRIGREYRSKTRPSLNSSMSELSSSGAAYNFRTFSRNASGYFSCPSTKEIACSSSFDAMTSSGIRHNSRNLRLEMAIFPAASTTRIPSAVDSSVALSRETVRRRLSSVAFSSVMSSSRPSTREKWPSSS